MKAGYLLFFALLAAMAAAASAPVEFSTDVFVGGRDGYPVYRIPALARTEAGVVLAFCEGRKTGIADHGNIDLVLKRSFDNGRSWGPLQVIESDGFRTWGNPAPVVDRTTGRIWLPFCLDNDRVFVTYSDDEGASWAPRREITMDVKPPGWGWYATGPGHAAQLSSGRLLVPCDHRSAEGVFSHVIYSDDHGESWRLGGILARGTDECMAAELGDGRVYLTMRNTFGKKRRAFAWSEDGGLSWSEVEIDDALMSPTCQASVLKIPDRDALLFVNPASTARENIAVRVSRDQAKSWSSPFTIYAGPGAYSDMTPLSPELVGVIYENGRVWPYSRISFAGIDLARLLAETD